MQTLLGNLKKRRRDGETYNAGFEEKHNHEHGETTPVRTSSAASVGANSRSNEDHDHSLEDHQDNTRLSTKVHKPRSSETSTSKQTLRNSVEVGALDVSLSDSKIRTRLLKVIDEVSRNTDLRANVRELRKSTPEKSVLLTQRLVDVSGSSGGHFSLVGHVGVGDFRDRCKVEDNSEDGDKGGNTKVDPLDSLERTTISADVLEDDLRSEHGSDDRANSLDGLGQLETELGPLGGTADGNVGVGRDFEGGQTRSSKEHGAAETAERSLDG